MPGQSGVDLLREARRSTPKTQRILLSGWTAEIDPGALAEADCVAVLGKPWDDAELKQAIQAALERD